MLELLLMQLLNTVIVPEIVKFVQDKYNKTGQWPTKEELTLEIERIRHQTNAEGTAFLNRPKV